MKVSDYIAKFLVNNGIKDLFLISGGMMHMLDSIFHARSMQCGNRLHGDKELAA